MKYTLKKSTHGAVKYLRVGEYVPVKSPDTWVMYKCPQCGFVTAIVRANHSINYLGEVTPVANCPHKVGGGRKCEFSAIMTLEDWVPEAKGMA